MFSLVVYPVLVLLLYFIYHIVSGDNAYPKIPVVGKKRSEWSSRPAQLRYLRSARQLIAEGLDKYEGHPFQIFTGLGPTIILPPAFLNGIKDDPRFTMTKFLDKWFFPDYPGFWTYGTCNIEEYRMNLELIRVYLNRSLSQLTAPLSTEAAYAVSKVLPAPQNNVKWREAVLYEAVVDLVSRLTARVVMGEGRCRDEEWLRISKTYTAVGYNAVRALRLCPPAVRRLMYWVLPATRALRRQYATCTRLIEEHQKKRREAGAGETEAQKLDYIHWVEAESVRTGRRYDVVRGQLGFVVAVMHTASALLTNIMFDLCAHPEYVALLRQEIRSVVGQSGRLDAKTQLQQLKLMDSFMKESQRLGGGNYFIHNRGLEDDVVLSDGSVLPKASIVATPAIVKDFYEDEHTFDGHRFLRLGEKTGNPGQWGFVSTSTEQLGFGIGAHACPGRFFASNQIKVALVHLLLEYDWKLPDGKQRPASVQVGHESIPDRKAKVLYKSCASF